MATKSSAAKFRDASEGKDSILMMLEAKRNILFERLQNIFDSSKQVHTDEAAREGFLSAVLTVDTLRSEFQKVVDDYNTRLLSVDSDAQPNFKCLISFDELYGQIKYVSSQFINRVSDLPHKHRPSLPPIELMSFNGDIRSWPLFYASFRSTIHENPSLTDAEKLYYLLGKITDKALASCTGVTPCAENYNILFKTLVDKYEDKRALASTYLDQIIDFKGATNASASNFDLFLDKYVTAVNALRNLKLEDLTDLFILHIALRKLDSDTVRTFEMSIDSNKIPKFSSLVKFIKNQSKILHRGPTAITSHAGSSRKQSDRSHSRATSKNNPPNYHAFVSTDNNTSSKVQRCLCNNVSFSHTHLFKCPQFNAMSPVDRFRSVKEYNACINCLSIKHRMAVCTSPTHCRICRQKHHTLLHFDKNSFAFPDANRSPDTRPTQLLTAEPTKVLPPVEACGPPASAEPPIPATAIATSCRADVSLCTTSIDASSRSASLALPIARQQCIASTTVLLATAQVIMYDAHGSGHFVRCLLDSASQSNFITKRCCELLGLKQTSTPHTLVRGIGGAEKTVKGSVTLQFSSRFNTDFKYNISSLIVDRITDSLPTATVDTAALSHLSGLPLADSSFATPSAVDVLIGASLFPHLLLPGLVVGDASTPPAIQTVLGYIVMGDVPTVAHRTSAVTSCCATVAKPVDELIKKFWELEELSLPPARCQDDIECEEFYRSTTVRDPVSGRYKVALPFRYDVYSLGNSYDAARRRFLCLERKLEASQKFRVAYDEVIKEYLLKGYLSPAPSDKQDPASTPMYVIPHHGVIREDRATTKLRIVLDASSKTSTGVSLNDILHSGENLQGDLLKILLNFRLFPIALSADCKQMFLQIEMRECDRKFQRIMYRFDPRDPLLLYQFNRVCFGLKSSPFHALRTVRQLIADDGHRFPRASEVATSSLYMDDIVCSTLRESDATEVAEELINLFKSAQLDLVKWSSNSPTVIDRIPISHRLHADVEFDKAAQQKILGLRWSQTSDNFLFKVALPQCDKCTKRSILSTIARLWDIMGFIAPVVLSVKLLIRQLWLLKIDWDDQPPSHIVKQWQLFCSELSCLDDYQIPRHLGVTEVSVVTLLGFSDASEQAYGGVVYLHVSSSNHDNIVRLVCAKSKVAPIKSLSVARLELCAAVLLSKLLRVVYDCYNSRHKVNVYAFTDSKVVLYWIKNSPHRWQTFVANRVVQLTENIAADKFYHVSGVENPADCLSRGLSPRQLICHPLWSCGPPWTRLDPPHWPLKSIEESAIDVSEVPEQKVLSHLVRTVNPEHSVLYLLSSRISSWSRILRVIAYVYRFTKSLPRRPSGSVTASDLEFAETKLLQIVQQKHFHEDLINLSEGEQCSPALERLKPFLSDDLIRVGGRLSNSTLTYSQKHPVVLPRHDDIVIKIIDHYHVKHFHAGPELLMSLLRQRYWILAARRIVRQRVHACNTCFRMRPRPVYPLMSDLPDFRVRESLKAFSHTGCDYAGPLPYVPARRRGVRSLKAWLCVFTCLTTRAVHVEIATDLSTPSFLAALKRFLARRGPIQCLYSDNGTNFVGSHNYLRGLYKFLNTEYKSRFEEELAENRITWKFIPPSAPHFGGCWESMGGGRRECGEAGGCACGGWIAPPAPPLPPAPAPYPFRVLDGTQPPLLRSNPLYTEEEEQEVVIIVDSMEDSMEVEVPDAPKVPRRAPSTSSGYGSGGGSHGRVSPSLPKNEQFDPEPPAQLCGSDKNEGSQTTSDSDGSPICTLSRSVKEDIRACLGTRRLEKDVSEVVKAAVKGAGGMTAARGRLHAALIALHEAPRVPNRGPSLPYCGPGVRPGDVTMMPKNTEISLLATSALFTLDTSRGEALARRLARGERYRRRCRAVVAVIALLFLLAAVGAVELLMSRGQRMFGAVLR